MPWKIGRSQNAQEALTDRFSYTMYDELGRITEVCKKPKPNGGMEPAGKDTDKWKSTHNSATYYTYDIHGNVDTLLQDYNSGIMATTNNLYKRIAISMISSAAR